MYPHIICFCGRSLGDIYDLFKMLRAERYVAAYKRADAGAIDPAMLAITESIHVDISDILDMLHLHTDCCRMRMQTQVEINSIY